MTELTTITVRFRVPKDTLFWAFLEAMQAAAKIFKGNAIVVYQSDSYPRSQSHESH